jgi:hypothetical protein
MSVGVFIYCSHSVLMEGHLSVPVNFCTVCLVVVSSVERSISVLFAWWSYLQWRDSIQNASFNMWSKFRCPASDRVS